MTSKNITPKLGGKSFNCPHCGALSHQSWFFTFIENYRNDEPPSLFTSDQLEEIINDPKIAKDMKSNLITNIKRLMAKEVFVEKYQDSVFLRSRLHSIYLSQCYSCEAFSVWIADDLIYPKLEFFILPNEDMPADVKADFMEAAAIVNLSPRGSAALLRLSIEKLLSHLNVSGKGLTNDIGELVTRGLDKRIQMALDVVRVIGNNAVHPGKIDIRDDKSVAFKLFDLVNLIVEATISSPKHVESMYNSLPEGVLKEIKRRDDL